MPIKKGTPKGRYYKTHVIDKGEKKVDLTAQPGPTPGPPVMPRPRRPEPDRALAYAIGVDGYPSQGPADAAVTLVIAHDYADPYSEKNRATLDELRKKYGKDLRIVYRNLVVHPNNAMAGALASCAADRQKKFEQMEDKLWEAFRQRSFDLSDNPNNQKCWDAQDGCANVVGAAKSIGLDVDRFKADMKGACMRVVQDDMKDLQTFALAATPSFFINGRYLSGAMPTANFETLIDEELAKAKAEIKKGTPRGRFYKTIILGRGEQRVDLSVTQPTQPTTRPMRPEPDKSKSYAIKVDGYPSRGPADAKVSVVMFFDYATPYAEKARTTLDDLVKKYGNDVRIVYRTRLVHPRNAHAAALALCAAHKVNKGKEMDAALWDKGFANRQMDNTEVDLGNGPEKCWDTTDGCKNVVEYAKDLGLDVNKFKSDVKSCVKTVNDDDVDAGTFQVNATPTFFVNGRVLVGAQPIENFSALVDAELALANDRIKKGTPKARYYKSWIIDKGEKSVP